MLTAVAIDVPTDLAPAAADAATRSCENAIGSGRCLLANQVDRRVGTSWYARVRPDELEPTTLRIEFKARSASGALFAQRTLAFSERDGPESRWASAGLVIAGLVAAEDATQLPATEANDKGDGVPVVAAPFRLDLRWGLDAGALAGQGLQHGAYRVGAFGRAWVDAPASGMLGDLSVRYAERGGDASLTWWSISAGAGARLGKKTELVNAELVGDIVFERVLVSAEDVPTGRQDSGGKSRFGGRISVNASAQVARTLRFVIGSDVSAMTPSVDIEVKGNSAGREPAVQFAFTAGLRLEL